VIPHLWTRAEAEHAAADALARHANETLGSWDYDAKDWTREARVVLDALGITDIVAGHLEQVGWVQDDGDEIHNFRYTSPSDRHVREQIADDGYEPVYRVVEP
jgi:hypothetical protein